MNLCLSFGTLPTDEQFDAAWNATWREEGKDPQAAVYKIRDGALARESGWAGDYDRNELYFRIVDACKAFDATGEGLDDEHSDIQMVSSVLYTLGIEWV